MKTKTKLLTLFLTLALLCGLCTAIAVSAAASDDAAPADGTGAVSETLSEFANQAKGDYLGRSGVVTALDGEKRFRYVATPDAAGKMNDGSFFSVLLFGDTATSREKVSYFSYEADISFENLPANAKMNLCSWYEGGDEFGSVTFSNMNGKLAVLAPDGTAYPVRFDELEWVHVAWIVELNHTDMSKCPATLYIDGEPFFTYDPTTGSGFFKKNGEYSIGQLRVRPDASAENNVPDATLLFRNFASYTFTDENATLSAFAKGEKNMKAPAGSYPEVVFNDSYSYPTSARTAVAKVGDTVYASVEEAMKKGNVTLLTHVLGTVKVEAPVVINPTGNAYTVRYTTDLGVTKEDNILRFVNTADDGSNVATFVFEIDGEPVLTKAYRLGAVPDVTASGLTLTTDLHHFYKGDSWKVDDTDTDWTMPTAITEEFLGKTTIVNLVGGKQVFATLACGEEVTYCTDAEALYTAVEEKMKGTDPLTVTYRANATERTPGLNLKGLTADIYLDINGQTLNGFFAYGKTYDAGFLNDVQTDKNVYVYSSQPGASVTTSQNFIYNFNCKATYHIGTLVKDGKWNAGDNLTVTATDLVSAISYDAKYYRCNVNGGTYNLVKVGSFAPSGVLCTHKDDGYTSAIAVFNDAKMTLGEGAAFLGFNASKKEGAVNTANVTLSGCTLTFAEGAKLYRDAFGATGTLTLTDTDTYGVRMENPADTTFVVTLGKGTTLTAKPADGVKYPDLVIARTDAANGVAVRYALVTADDTATVTWKHGDLVIGEEAWKKGSTPAFEKTDAFGDFYFAAVKAKDPITESKEYQLSLKSKVSKIKGNLTLYSNISFNLYLDDAAITEVTAIVPDAEKAGQTKTLTLTVSREDGTYKIYRLDGISPKDLTKTFEIRLTLVNEEKTYTYAVTTSLANYAKSVLTNADESAEGKALVASLIDYVREAALYFETATEEDTVMQTIKTLLKNYGYTRPEWTKGTVYEIEGGTLLTGAALNLGNNPGFLFFVGDGFTGEITVKYGDTVKVYTSRDIKQYETVDGAKSAIRVDLHASEYRELITLTAGDETMTYNLDTYIQGIIDANKLTEAPAYAQALAAYSDAAKAYLERQ